MAAKRRPKRHVPPSRLRYEQENPTVSFRLPWSLRADLSDILNVSGQSFADFVKEALGAKERSVGAAYDTGRRVAKEDYLVTYPCTVCRKTIEVDSDNEKLAARKFFEESRWGHGNCINR